MPFEALLLLLSKASTVLDEALEFEETDLLVIQPLSTERGRIDQEEEARDAESNGNDSLKKEDPPPTARRISIFDGESYQVKR